MPGQLEVLNALALNRKRDLNNRNESRALQCYQ
jgi:hypothetical protein